MSRIQDDEVIQAFSSNRANQSLDIWILPWTLRRRQNLSFAKNTSGAKALCSNAMRDWKPQVPPHTPENDIAGYWRHLKGLDSVTGTFHAIRS